MVKTNSLCHECKLQEPFYYGEGSSFKKFYVIYIALPPTFDNQSKLFGSTVYADGSICLDILQNQWSPIYDVAAILTSIQVCTPITSF
jgi:hypothetical protein